MVDVSWHVDVDPAFILVPVESKAAVEGAFQIDGGFLVLLEVVDEMVCVGFGELFDSKVIDTEGKHCSAGAVLPQSSGVWHGFVSVGC